MGDLCSLLQDKTREIELQEAKIKRLVSNFETNERRFEQYREQARKTIAKFVLELEKAKLREDMDDLMSRQKRFGFLKGISAVKSLDDWVDGIELQKLKEEKRKIQQELDEIRDERKAFRARRSTSFDEESRGKFKTQTIQLTKRQEEIDKELARATAEKFEIVYRQRRCAENQDCLMSAARPEMGLQAWPTIGRYQFLSLIGKGGFSEVYKAYDLEEFRYVVCKIHQMNPKWDDSTRENFVKHANRENDVYKSLKHPNIVAYFDTIEIDRFTFATVIELCEGPDLDYILKKQGALSEREAKTNMRQILAALKYLHELNPKVIHYDIKPQNILFTKSNVLKLTDFGLCKLFDGEESRMELTSQGSGTYWYLPPEVFETGHTPPLISTKLDIWSAGVVFYQMLFGRKPFGHNMSQDRIQLDKVILRSTAVAFPDKPAVSQESRDLIRKMLVHDQANRLDVYGAIAALEST